MLNPTADCAQTRPISTPDQTPLRRRLPGNHRENRDWTRRLRADGRSALARRHRDLVRAFLAETGGRQEPLAQQAATLTIQREVYDAQIKRGEWVDPLCLTRICNALNRTIEKIKARTGDPATEAQRREAEDREAGLLS